MPFQETEGLLSSFIRDARLSQAASCIGANSAVLDLACGAGKLELYLPKGCTYYGVDRIPVSPSATNPPRFMTLDLLEDSAVERIREQLPEKPLYIACIAFLEHLPYPTEFLARYSSLLHPKGRVVATTPHPHGRMLHEALARVRLLSRSAAREHETFLGKKRIEDIASASGGKLISYKRFLFGMNQIFIIQYP
jgi:2-polyprenyl-3-methyl-5-hydroxy-6-metoxy-1,4-benzoquinol methylase